MTQRMLGRRIYAGLAACASLETCTRFLINRIRENKPVTTEILTLLDSCLLKANIDRQDADAAMHEMGIGYYQIYDTKTDKKSTRKSKSRAR